MLASTYLLSSLLYLRLNGQPTGDQPGAGDISVENHPSGLLIDGGGLLKTDDWVTKKAIIGTEIVAKNESSFFKAGPVKRLDYEPPEFKCSRVFLDFKLDPINTIVRATLELSRQPSRESSGEPSGGASGSCILSDEVAGCKARGSSLILDGENLELLHVSLDLFTEDSMEDSSSSSEDSTESSSSTDNSTEDSTENLMEDSREDSASTTTITEDFTTELIVDRDFTLINLARPNIESKLIIYDHVFENLTVFNITTISRIHPRENSLLMGLFESADILATQCEPHGFRRMAYSLDRPDVLSSFVVHVEADKLKYPTLLSNGNLLESGITNQEGEERHYAVFEDPWPKPTYLFALVAGDLVNVTETRQNMKTNLSRGSDDGHDDADDDDDVGNNRDPTSITGDKVSVSIHSSKSHGDKLDWALKSVLKSMEWDEKRFGRYYDLSEFHVVCVEDFNAGAMENKGLNIFTANAILASPQTSTDSDFETVQAIIAHEYFHNWSGDRVTCRDWFSLTLKEGLTVFRDQEFTSDVMDRSIKRIEDVRVMLSSQFAEDSGPLAHPIQPDFYNTPDNFYTVTVYEKGAEIIRMYQTLLGSKKFHEKMTEYFDTYDGQAVSCQDFLGIMLADNPVLRDQFGRWYHQKGTPRIIVTNQSWNETEKIFRIKIKQLPPQFGHHHDNETSAHHNDDDHHHDHHDDGDDYLPMVIPIRFGLIGLESKKDILDEHLLILTDIEQSFEFENVTEKSVVSILRDFSAPVQLDPKFYEFDQRLFLAAYDSDPVQRWMSAQAVWTSIILGEQEFTEAVKEFAQNVLLENGNWLAPLLLTMPQTQVLENEILAREKLIDPIWLAESRTRVRATLSECLKKSKISTIINSDDNHHNQEGSYSRASRIVSSEFIMNEVQRSNDTSFDVTSVNQRRRENFLLATKVWSELANRTSTEAADLLLRRAFDTADSNFNNFDFAVSHLAQISVEPQRSAGLNLFYQKAGDDILLINKWLRFQASSEAPDTLLVIKELIAKNSWLQNTTNPQRLRSIYQVIAQNPKIFHTPEGYEFIGAAILRFDKFNANLAARLARSFTGYKKYASPFSDGMKNQLTTISKAKEISRNLHDIVSSALNK